MPIPSPGRLDLIAYRGSIYLHDVVFLGQALYDTSFYLTVRAFRDAPGDPLIFLQTTAAGTQGMSSVVFTEDGVTSTRLTIQIDEDTIMETLPFDSSGRPADAPDVSLVYDIHILSFEAPRYRALEGAFTISAGVTRL